MSLPTRIRILSALSLLMLLAIFVLGVLIVLSNPGLAAMYVLCAVAVAAGGWVMLRTRGKRWWWGTVLASAALLAALGTSWALFSDPRNVRRLLVLVVLSVAYTALVGWLSRSYWQARRRSRRGAAIPHEQTALIINPKSGDGRATKANLAQKASARGVQTVVMEPGQDMVELAEQALSRGATVLGVSGGDGSLGVLASVAIKHDVPLVVLPGGTRCHFARDIGLDPGHIEDGLAGFEGVERRVDVGMIAGRVFLNNASFGLYADIISRPEYRDHKLEVSRKVARELASSEKPYYPLEFADGNAKPWQHAAQVLVGVNRYETINLGELGERRRLDEGILQVIALPALDDQLLGKLVTSLKLGAANAPFAEWTTQDFTISSPSGWIEAGVDGESLRLPSPVKLRIRPRALRLRVPAEGARERPVKPLSGAAASTLWNLVWAKNR
jgi:diacylglycerol kinase family enzyme